MKIGYARVSTSDQNLTSQIDALNAAGCQKIFQDVVSGAKAKRPGLNRMLETVRPGDSLIICKLDRLGRSLRHLVSLVNQLLTSSGIRLIRQSALPFGLLRYTGRRRRYFTFPVR